MLRQLKRSHVLAFLNAASVSRLLRKRGGNSVVECDLAKVDVEGSNPFRRSILLRLQQSATEGFAEIATGGLVTGPTKPYQSFER